MRWKIIEKGETWITFLKILSAKEQPSDRKLLHLHTYICHIIWMNWNEIICDWDRVSLFSVLALFSLQHHSFLCSAWHIHFDMQNGFKCLLFQFNIVCMPIVGYSRPSWKLFILLVQVFRMDIEKVRQCITENFRKHPQNR